MALPLSRRFAPSGWEQAARFCFCTQLCATVFFRKWSYEVFGSDRVIKFIVMATPEDIKANALYLHLADEFIQVPGGPNNNNYANVALIVELAERVGV